MPFKKDNLRKVTKDEDGKVIEVEPQFVQVHFMGTDFVYQSNFPTPSLEQNQGTSPNVSSQTIPRFGIGAFLSGLKHLYKTYYGYDPEIIEYGKPSLKTMLYV